MWRPSEWDKTFSSQEVGYIKHKLLADGLELYEAGADAMLGVLRKQGLRIPEDMMSTGEVHTLLFIPDEKEG